MRRPEWAPADVDMDAASPARVYDALLGGSHNFEVDRQAARWGTEAVPDLPAAVLANRHFLRRAVGHLAASGVTQFIDLGAGIPTVGSTHEVVQSWNPDCKVVYVDIDAVAGSHATAILAGNDRAIAVSGDLRSPLTVLADPAVTSFLDLSQPVAVLLVAVVHLLTDEDDAPGALATLRDRLAPGSHLGLTSLTSSDRPTDATRLTGVAQRDRISLTPRPKPWIESLFGDFSLLAPGLLPVADWRPEPDPLPANGSGPRAAAVRDLEAGRGQALILGGVARKD
jgi:hypothetical protein